jgi:ribosomal protein S18 acetylase RimI-like enzyme
VVSRGRLHDAAALPALVAEEGERRLGLATFRDEDGELEVVTLDALEPGRGVGTALIEALAREARERGRARLWLITTNDNTPALRFYQRRGFQIAAVRLGALAASRALKPEIPEAGLEGIPLRDEIELEVAL